MALRSSGNQATAQVKRYQAMSCTDSLDIGETGEGGMIALQNLVTDPSTKNIWQCRPASTLLTNFAGFTTPGFISGMIVVGHYVVGMIATGRTAGMDEPFVYDLVANAFVTITGVTAANVPTSPPSSGPWTPPILALVSAKVLIAHPGYSGTGTNYFGVVDMTTASAPTYHTQNTSTNGLPCPPISISAYSNRAWFACNPSNAIPGLFFSDAGNPLTITNSGTAQVLTLNDSVPITALGTLQYQNQLGGIVQALIAFKGIGNVYQITGDAALSGNNALALNALNVETGTLSPLSITNTPKGMIFLSPDGFRMINQNGIISDVIGANGTGVTCPFIYSQQPSRIVCQSNAKIVRASVLSGYVNPSMQVLNNTGAQEWWYDVDRGVWAGPHTLPADQIVAYNDTFIIAPIGISHSLYQSDYKQRSTSTFMEPYPLSGQGSTPVQMQFVMQYAYVPDLGEFNQLSIVEAYLMVTFAASQQAPTFTQLNGTVIDEFLNPLTTFALVNFNPQVSSLWGSAVWGTSIWGGSPGILTPITFNFDRPFSFSRASFVINGSSAQGVEVGDMFCRVNVTGMMKTAQANSNTGQIK
jgi:hypothetical protein